MIYSISYLAGVRYPRLLLDHHPKGFGACVFAEIFGDAFSVMNMFLSKHSENCPVLEMQLIWDDNHRYGDKDIKKIVSLSKKYNALALLYPQTRIELSPFCEHNLGKPDKYLQLCQENAVHCHIVNTPNKGAFSLNYKNEVHGTKTPPLTGDYNFDFDGTSCFEVDINKYLRKHNKAEIFKLWTWEMNLLRNSTDHTPRKDRRVRPSAKLIKSMVNLVKHPSNG